MANFSSELLAKVTEAGNVLARRIAENVSKNNLPSAISENIILRPATRESDTRYSIEIAISLAEDAAPMAAAFEFGSGIHSTRGNQGHYVIEPREKSVLKFMFPEAQNIHPRNPEAPVSSAPDLKFDDEGNVYLPRVMHPGVAPRPFIQPAIEEARPTIEELFMDAIEAEFDIMIRELNAQK